MRLGSRGSLLLAALRRPMQQSRDSATQQDGTLSRRSCSAECGKVFDDRVEVEFVERRQQLSNDLIDAFFAPRSSTFEEDLLGSVGTALLMCSQVGQG